MITREQITTTLQAHLEPHDWVLAMWQGGAAAFDRVDQWSDIDLQLTVVDDKVDAAFDVVRGALESLSPLEIVYRLPEPTWHGHSQTFYQLRDASEFLLVDCAILKRSSPNHFIQPEVHGSAVVHFDKAEILATGPFDYDALEEQIARRKADLRARFGWTQTLVRRGIERKVPIEAHVYYVGYTLQPIRELLRMKYDRTRYDWSWRYLYIYLPSDTVRRLERLMFVRDLDDLKAKHVEAIGWFWKLIEE